MFKLIYNYYAYKKYGYCPSEVHRLLFKYGHKFFSVKHCGLRKTKNNFLHHYKITEGLIFKDSFVVEYGNGDIYGAGMS